MTVTRRFDDENEDTRLVIGTLDKYVPHTLPSQLYVEIIPLLGSFFPDLQSEPAQKHFKQYESAGNGKEANYRNDFSFRYLHCILCLRVPSPIRVLPIHSKSNLEEAIFTATIRYQKASVRGNYI